MNNILEVNNVSKSFGKFKALSDVSINVPKNSIFGLPSPNGAGKTTLIRIINQITLPDFGSVKLDGELLCSRQFKILGYLPEERGLYKSMKVSEQALYLAQLKGLSYKDAKRDSIIGLKSYRFLIGGTKSSRAFKRHGAENSVYSYSYAPT